MGALLDEIEDAVDSCLFSSDGVPVRRSHEDLELSLVAVAARFGPVEVALPTERPSGAGAVHELGGVDEVDAFSAWLHEGHRLGFIVWGD